MAAKFMQIVLTPAVQQAQDKYFGKHQVVESAPETDPLARSEAYFIDSRDSFYMATISETGWPYLQHRGGPAGFVKVLGPNLIGFADFKGNRQLLSTGNLDVTDRVALFMMDYPHRTRLKLLGHARVLDAREHPELVDQLAPNRSATSGAAVPHPGHFLRLELPAIRHPALHRRRGRKRRRPLKARIAELEAQLAARGTCNRRAKAASLRLHAKKSRATLLPCAGPAIHADDLAVNEGPRG